MSTLYRPTIVGIGGTTRSGSSSEKALRAALAEASAAGAEVEEFIGVNLDIPMYAAESSARTPGATLLTDALRRADGIIIASPGYHGSVSGLVKNAIDYVEDLRDDAAPYFDGRAVGLIACAAGCQAAVNTLAALRSIVHALRGWPTPLAVAMSTKGFAFSADGLPTDTAAQEQLSILAKQVVAFSQMRALHERPPRA
jgi:FMN reductase